MPWIRRTVEEVAADTGRTADEVERLLAAGREKMRAARDARPMPYVDRTLYTGWNAMMASAMLAAAPLLDRQDLDRDALATLERVFADASVGDGAGGVRHALGSEVAGILEDQVQAAAAALDAWEVTGNRAWLDRATRLMQHVWETYRAEDGGLYDRAEAGGEGFLSQRLKPVQDAPTPSANGVAAIADAPNRGVVQGVVSSGNACAS